MQLSISIVGWNQSFIKLDHCYRTLRFAGLSAFQLMAILEEARHSLILLEHDLMLYEHVVEMTEYISKSMSDAAKEAAVLLYSPGTDTFLEDHTRNADRYSTSRKGRELHRS